MGLFSGPKMTLTELAAEIPPTQRTWIVRLGDVSLGFPKGAAGARDVDAAVAEVEATGWQLEQIIPSVRSTDTAGQIASVLLGVFRRT